MKNPFSITFGREPDSLVSRLNEVEQIIESYINGDNSSPVYMITGIRGSGKTVAMTGVANTFRKNKDWIVVDLNPERDLIRSLVGELSNSVVIKEAKFNLSFLGLGMEIKGEAPITDIKDIRSVDDMSSNKFNRYKLRLVEKGIVNAKEHGVVKYILPNFREFVIKSYIEYL